MKRTVSVVFSLLILGILSAQNRYSFIENKGQWPGDFRFKAEIPAGAMFIEDHGITYHFIDWSEWHEMHGKPLTLDHDPILKGHAVKVNFVNSLKPSHIQTSSPQSYYHNYYRGNDPNKWASKLYPMGTVLLENVWSNIDLQYYNSGGKLKYDFIVNPGADFSKIQLNYTGVDEIVLKDGAIAIKTSLGEMIEEKPYAYQVIN